MGRTISAGVILCFSARLMKTINIAQYGSPGSQWRQWIKALAEAEFEVCTVNPLSMELPAGSMCCGDVVLVDGMLPNLRRFVEHLHDQCPGIHVVVATEERSFTIRYEVMLLKEAVYVSGPMSGRDFTEAVLEEELAERGVDFTRMGGYQENACLCDVA